MGKTIENEFSFLSAHKRQDYRASLPAGIVFRMVMTAAHNIVY